MVRQSDLETQSCTDKGLDRWNKAIEQQAFCRVYRIGQLENTVLVHLVVKDTIDERMEIIKDHKQGVIDSLVDVDKARKGLSKEDLLGLFGFKEPVSRGEESEDATRPFIHDLED